MNTSETSAPSHRDESAQNSTNPASASCQATAGNVPVETESVSPTESVSTAGQKYSRAQKRSAEQLAKLKQHAERFVRVDCPACGDATSSQTVEKDQFLYDQCATCRTWFLNPRPTPEVLSDYFGDPENSRYWAKQIFPATETSASWIRQQPGLNRILDLCERFAVRKRQLVQFHAGFGEFASLASVESAFAHVLAVEPHPELAQACRSRGVNVLQKPLEELGDEVPDADVVVAFDMLARQFDPAMMFRQANRFLRDRGLLIGSCPNGECFEMSVLGSACDLVDPEHLNLFNPDSLTRLAKAHGFEILEIKTESGCDVEMVREAIAEQPELLAGQPFLQRILNDRDPAVIARFQQFLNDSHFSTPIWFAARRRTKSR